jgi:pSer/pThr/pTyr-binding forkhead associated (FHA) protein
MKLFLRRDEQEVHVVEVGPRPVHLGRGPDNQLILPDSTVSMHHATVWTEGGRTFVRDQGSRNGTFVNDERVHGTVEVQSGDVLRVGTTTELVLRGRAGSGAAPKSQAWVVEALDIGATFPVQGNRFYIGSGENANIQVEGGEHEAALQFHDDDEVWLATYDEEGPLVPGQEFTVGARRYRLSKMDHGYTPTHIADANGPQFRYKLVVTLDGVAGPEATLEDPATHTRHVIAAENRAVLLYVLCKRNVEARKRGDEALLTEESWCNDEEVARDIWGKKGTTDANSLHVLVHRLRKEIKKAGFDPWFIEKRRKAIRVALQDVVLT